MKDELRSQKFSPNGFVSLQGSKIKASSAGRIFSSSEVKTNYKISSEALEELYLLKQLIAKKQYS